MISFSRSLAAQQPVSNSADAQREAMRKLSFLAGHWSGRVNVVRGPGEPLHLTQTEVVEYKLDRRILLVEGKSTEGRQNTESWGWTFVLWGLAYYLAIAWSAWDHSAWAWLATISAAVVVTGVVASLKAGHHPTTTLARAVGSIWIPLGSRCFCSFPPSG